MKPTLMLIGLGDLGAVLLELLARQAELGRIVVASRNAEHGLARCNLTRLGALAQGYAPDLRFVSLNLHNREAVAEIVRREAPNLILSTATMQTWWLPDLLPPLQAAAINRAGFGVWLPVHLTLTLKLMESLAMAGYGGLTLTAPFPDVVNCVLGRLGLAPTGGIGNLDEIVPKVRLLAAERLAAPLESVQVWLVAHHALEPFAFGHVGEATPPYFVRIEQDGRDVTETCRADELLLTPYPLPTGPVTHFLTAGSAVRLVRALLADSPTLLHAPAPNGLPGGYPVLASRQGLQPASIPGLTLAEAIDINERSHPFDGIERIEADGTVVFRADSAAALRETLGYDCVRLVPADTEERAGELMARFRRYARQHGVDLEAISGR